jgi:hypothetical protein
MNCEQFRQALVEDEPARLRECEDHAARCAACAEVWKEDRRILEEAAAWRREIPAPAPSLEERIATAISREVRGRAGRPRWSWPRLLEAPLWQWGALAAAAAVVVAVLALHQLLPIPWEGPARETSLASLLREIEEAERSHITALARLDREAARILERADDPGLPAEEAALLLAYGDRLKHLDAVIAEVRGFLEQNPGHSGGHKVLIAAYREKSDVLQEVLNLQLGDPS